MNSFEGGRWTPVILAPGAVKAGCEQQLKTPFCRAEPGRTGQNRAEPGRTGQNRLCPETVKSDGELFKNRLFVTKLTNWG